MSINAARELVLNRTSRNGNRMASRLFRNFVTLTAVGILVTILAMARLSRDQIVWTVDTMRATNQSIVRDASRRFKTLGGTAVKSSAERAGRTSLASVNNMTGTLSRIQSRDFSRAAQEFSSLSSQALNRGLVNSIAMQNGVLKSSQVRQGRLLARFATDMQHRAGTITQAAMLALNREVVRGRALALADRLEERINSAPVFLKFTAQMIDMGRLATTDRKVKLDALVRRVPEFRTVCVLNKSGDEITKCAANQLILPSQLVNCSGNEWYKQAISGLTYVGLAKHKESDGGPMLRLAVPITEFAGHSVGVLAATYSLDEIWSEIAETRIGTSGFALVQDSAGNRLVAGRRIPTGALTASVALKPLGWRVTAVVPRQEAMQPIVSLNTAIEKTVASARIDLTTMAATQAKRASGRLQRQLAGIQTNARQAMNQRVSGALVTLRNGERHQVEQQTRLLQTALQRETRQSIQETNAKMSTAADTVSRTMRTRLKPVAGKAIAMANHRITFMALLISLLACIATAFAAHYTARAIVRPVLQLSSAATDIAHGHLDRRVEETGPVELAEMARAFNTMSVSLQKSKEELQETEGQLVQSAKLASLGTLSAGVAHELNQPLAIIRGVAQQAVQDTSIEGDLREDLNLIIGQTGRMVKIVRHLRTFSRAGTEEHSMVSVNSTIEDCFILVGAQLKAHNISVQLKLSEQNPAVSGDANELEQVLLNLITNARDALEDVDNATITITSEASGGRVRVVFEDNGPGIPQEAAAKIFDPFFTTKAPGKGTGLGLSISHSIIKKHGAEISVRNNNGAQFTLDFPAWSDPELTNSIAA